MKLPNLNLQRWFAPVLPRLATNAGADKRFGTMMFSSRSGGDDDYGFPDDETQVSEAPAERQRAPRTGGSGGGDRGNGSGGRQRTIQFQPEDRYWTEYLRIALPIIGLILMLGLFWYWATQIIGDDTDPDDPVPTETVGQVETIAAEPTDAVTPTEESTVAVTPDETSAATEEPTEAPADGDNTSGEETPADGEEQPTEEPADTGGDEFAADDVVVVNDSGVNLRAAPTTAEDNIVATLDEGEELIILGGPESGENYEWYEVVTSDGEFTGFIASEFIEAAG